jgi:DNA-binding response OmpR family regulator
VETKILLIDANAQHNFEFKSFLEKEGYKVKTATDGIEGYANFKLYDPGIVIMNLILPRKDGLDICRTVREFSECPIIILSEKKDPFDVVIALELGADDYVTKPFDQREMLARIRAILRRCTQRVIKPSSEVIKYDKIEISYNKYELKLDGTVAAMPPKEFELLYFLASNYNRVFSRDQLLDKIWGFDYLGDSRTVDVHVKRIRAKINGISDKWELKTIWGIGYKFELYQ